MGPILYFVAGFLACLLVELAIIRFATWWLFPDDSVLDNQYDPHLTGDPVPARYIPPLGLGLWVVLLVFIMVLGASHAFAQEEFGMDMAPSIYRGLKNHHAQLCCGPNDCEVVTAQEVKVGANGDATLFSRRHQRWVRVSHDLITWMPIPGADPEDAAHWCGYKRDTNAKDDLNQIDQTFHSYCTFITPGGV